MSKLEITRKTVGMLSTNCYLLTNTATKETIIVDPGADADILMAHITDKDYAIVAILLTHGHYDHIGAAMELKNKYNVKIYAHQDEQEVLESVEYNLSGMFGDTMTATADELVRDGQILDIAGFNIEVLHTKGHTKGGVCYYIADEGIVMCGDTIFCESVGRTDFPTGSTSELVRSIREKILVLPDEIRLYPGHNGMTTVGYEKKYNPCI